MILNQEEEKKKENTMEGEKGEIRKNLLIIK